MSDRNADPVAPATPSDVADARPAKAGADWWGEIKGVFWLILAVLAFHSFIAKPFFIPSESMMPNLLIGDRLVVSKFPFGWSWVSPSFHLVPPFPGRLFGRLPVRGDIVIVTPPGMTSDYIKRVVGLPGDTLEVRGGRLVLNGTEVPWRAAPPRLIAIDTNTQCASRYQSLHVVYAADGRRYCALPIVHETLPNGRNYDTVDFGYFPDSPDDYGPVLIPPDHVFVMGDNRDESADSRVPSSENGLGGPVPFENVGGRAELITFSFDGSSSLINPISWFTALRGGRAGTSLRPAIAPVAAAASK